jgi:hypothetical protein
MFAAGWTTLTLFGYVIRLGSPVFWVLCAAAVVGGFAGPPLICDLFASPKTRVVLVLAAGAAALSLIATLSGCATQAKPACLSACGSSSHPGASQRVISRYPVITDGPVTPVGDKVALAYLKSHPVPHRRGMVAGITVANSAYGNDLWDAFSLTALTASGHTVMVLCGDPRTERSCPLQKGEVDLPDDLTNGIYLYVRADGAGNAPGDYRLITLDAVRLPQICSAEYLSSGAFPYNSRFEQCVAGSR